MANKLTKTELAHIARSIGVNMRRAVRKGATLDDSSIDSFIGRSRLVANLPSLSRRTIRNRVARIREAVKVRWHAIRDRQTRATPTISPSDKPADEPKILPIWHAPHSGSWTQEEAFAAYREEYPEHSGVSEESIQVAIESTLLTEKPPKREPLPPGVQGWIIEVWSIDHWVTFYIIVSPFGDEERGKQESKEVKQPDSVNGVAGASVVRVRKPGKYRGGGYEWALKLPIDSITLGDDDREALTPPPNGAVGRVSSDHHRMWIMDEGAEYPEECDPKYLAHSMERGAWRVWIRNRDGGGRTVEGNHLIARAFRKSLEWALKETKGKK